MKTVTLRELRRESGLLDRAAAGEELVVTKFGRPFVRVLPAKGPVTFVGAGKHLATEAVSPDRIPEGEWGSLQ